jgi:predicted nucleotidyltransferase
MKLPASGAAGHWQPDNAIGSNGVSNADDSLPPSGSTLRQAFEALVTTFDERGIRYAIIGGIATIQHTRVRTTDDIDALLTVPQLAMPGLFEALRGRGFSLDVLGSIRDFRDGGMTTVRFKDVLVDLMRPVLPAYAHVLDRAISARIFGQTVRVSSAEGLIVMKLIAMRSQDEADVQDLLAAYAGKLDLDYVRKELETFTEGSDPRRAKFELWVAQLGQDE